MGMNLCVYLAIISQKGGCSKTTLAVSLAVAAERDGKKVALFDLDPQASAIILEGHRAVRQPGGRVVPVCPARSDAEGRSRAGGPRHHRRAAIRQGHRLRGGAAGRLHPDPDQARRPRRHVDGQDPRALLSHYGKPAAVVLTFCPVQGREVVEMEASIRKLGATVAPVRMHHRIAHPRAQQTGLTAQEFEPDGKAADEIQRLWMYACMNLWSNKHAAAA